MTPFLTRWVALVSLLAPAIAAAQVAVSKPPLEDAIVLSPFVVDATTDTGYQATSTLAGSRLKTELRDVAASVTVLTNEFMDDLGANDIATALAFAPGAENDSTTDPTGTNSLNQGYVGGDFGDVNNRSGEVRVRGLGRASTTANYIQILGSTDRYNTERAEFLRGANSILFGLAEPAGLINYSTKVANLRKNAVKLEVKLDNFGSNREVLDVSQVLVKDKLAVRAVGLYSDTKYELDTAYQKDKRIFLTGNYQPFKGTSVRAYYEAQDTFGRRPNFRTVQDNVSEWLTSYNQYARSLTPAQLAAAFYWDPTTPTATGTPLNTIVTTTDGRTVDLGLIRRPLDGNANGTAMFYTGADWNNPQANTVTIFSNRTVTGGATNGATRSAFARSASSRENTALFNDPQVTSKGIFPYDQFDIGALPGNFRGEKDHKFHVTIDQRVTETLYLSASFQEEKRTHEQVFNPLSQTHQISIDVNTKLPDGRTNPNFLRPFIYGRSVAEATDATATNYLVQANYDFDFAKKASSSGWLSHLGLHRLTALYTNSSTERFRYQFNYQLDNSIPGMTETGVASGGAARQVYQVWYVGEPVQAGDTALRFTGFPTNTVAHVDRSFDYLYYDNTATPRAWVKSPQPVHIGRQLVAGGRSYTEQNNDGLGISLQSFFWERKIVTLFGWREDYVESFNHTLTSDPFPFPTIAGGSKRDYVKGDPQFTNRTPTMTQSLVYHVTDWLRVFGNRSENFAATTPRQDNLYRPIAPQSGLTEEVGFGLNLMQGKLNVRVSAFRSAQELATSSQASATAGLRVVAFEDTLYNALNAAGRLSEWTTFSPQGVTTDRYERPLNSAATEDSVSEGGDIEVTYRPLPGWDISASVSKLENVSTNVGRELGEFLDVRAPFYGKYFAEEMRIDGTNKTNPSSATLVADRFISQVAANYTSDIIREGTSNRGVSEYTAKLVTRYSFREGSLKGMSLGANFRWEQSKIIGYRQKDAVFNVGGLNGVPGKVSDTSQPFMSDSIIAGGFMANYSRRIFSGRVKWRVQLNAQNYFGDHGLRTIAANPDGSSIWGLAPARVYELTNTFEF